MHNNAVENVDHFSWPNETALATRQKTAPASAPAAVAVATDTPIGFDKHLGRRLRQQLQLATATCHHGNLLTPQPRCNCSYICHCQLKVFSADVITVN